MHIRRSYPPAGPWDWQQDRPSWSAFLGGIQQTISPNYKAVLFSPFRDRLSAIGYIGYEGAKPSMNLTYINSLNYGNNTYTTDHQRTSYATNTISLRAGVQYALTR